MAYVIDDPIFRMSIPFLKKPRRIKQTLECPVFDKFSIYSTIAGVINVFKHEAVEISRFISIDRSNMYARFSYGAVSFLALTSRTSICNSNAVEFASTVLKYFSNETDLAGFSRLAWAPCKRVTKTRTLNNHNIIENS
jgi:hypothetical protein